jgi:GNAT superfamily N-acetyltransferase
MAELLLLTAHQTRPYFDRLIDIYQAVFSQSPYYETLPDTFNFAGRLSYHSRQPGFRCAIIIPAPGSPAGGFAYGYHGQPGTWLYNLAAIRLPASRVAEFFGDCFEFAELALLPDWQGQGLGGMLHDALLEGLPHRTACLSTIEVETNALHLYQNRGWKKLTGGIELPGTLLKYQIMAKSLHNPFI